MTNDILWLVRLGIDQGLFTREHCKAVRAAVGDAAEIGDFAQRLIDDGYVEDVETLEKVAGLAMAKGQKSAPSGDPFAESGTEPPFEAAPVAKAEGEGKKSAAGPMPKFPFENVAALDDAGLASAFRALLRQTGEFGASDLHLSTGSRPFLRKNRQLFPLTEEVLS